MIERNETLQNTKLHFDLISISKQPEEKEEVNKKSIKENNEQKKSKIKETIHEDNQTKKDCM